MAVVVKSTARVVNGVAGVALGGSEKIQSKSGPRSSLQVLATISPMDQTRSDATVSLNECAQQVTVSTSRSGPCRPSTRFDHEELRWTHLSANDVNKRSNRAQDRFALTRPIHQPHNHRRMSGASDSTKFTGQLRRRRIFGLCRLGTEVCFKIDTSPSGGTREDREYPTCGRAYQCA
jgi:hypothetical protein